MRRYSQDLLAGVLIVALNLVVFGVHSGRLGFYADDAGFLTTIYPDMGVQRLISWIGSYVTGRNLHILWQYVVSVIAGGSGLENLLLCTTRRRPPTLLPVYCCLSLFGCGASDWPQLIAAIGFSLYPVHDELTTGCRRCR